VRTAVAGVIVFASVGMSLAACSTGGSSGPNPARAVPAAVHPAAVPPARGGVRRTASVPSCSGLGTGAFVGGGFDNVADGAYSGVLEGNSNQVCDESSSIGGGYSNFISSGQNSSYYSFIGAGYGNSISEYGDQSFIGGGNDNALTAANSVIGGGNKNTLTATESVIVGGSGNAIYSGALYGFIGAGTNNSVSGEGAYIAAGGYNTASGEGAVVDGGFNSSASGNFATIPGGYRNSAAGIYSFAAGAYATAAQTGTFVWSDGSHGSTALSSTRAYEFLARASGGFTFYTNAASTVGAQLSSGSGSWASLSDRNAKTNVAPLNVSGILAKLDALPISRWSYKTEHGVRHVGPMAQDFYAAFGVGEDDRHITSIDEDGVALAAIKALHAENAALRRRLASDEAHERRVEAELSAVVRATRR